MEKDLSTSTVTKFIHKETTILPEAHIFPSLKTDLFTRGILKVHTEREFEKLLEFLENPNHIIVSSHNRPWVVTEMLSGEDYMGTTMEHCNGMESNSELKVICSGTDEYLVSKKHKENYTEFNRHHKLVLRRLAFEEEKISRQFGKIIFLSLQMCCRMTKKPSILVLVIAAAVILTVAQSALGMQFYLQKEECFLQKVDEDGDIVRVSFVVVRRKSKLHASTAGVDLVVKGPNGEQVHDDRDKKTEHYEFVAKRKGMYRFCFTNKAGSYQLVDFNVAINHQDHLEPAKDEHLNGVKEKIGKLQRWLKAVEFKLDYLIRDSYRIEEVNEDMSFWAITKAAVESVALVGSSILQVYLLKRLFKRKLESSSNFF
ncbi:hypothetical protein QQ045_008216 [Rhodiola kirilowii]